MCLTVQDINEQLPKEFVPMKAEKDIGIYKMLEYVTIVRNFPYLHKVKIYRTPYMWSDVEFNLFGKCVMKTGGKMTGEYITIHSYRNYLLHGRFDAESMKQVQNIEWVNGKNISNVTRSNDIGINDKETLTISEGIHACIKIPRKRFLEYRSDYRELHKAIIPKGSYYFIDEVNDEIVADKMIILKKVVK